MPAEEIKPCPFCGSSNIGFIFYDKPLSNCMDCGAEGPINFEGWLDEDCMKAAWNRRADTVEYGATSTNKESAKSLCWSCRRWNTHCFVPVNAIVVTCDLHGSVA